MVDIVGLVIALFFTAVALFVAVALPIVAIRRVSRAQADVARLAKRLAAVERELAGWAAGGDGEDRAGHVIRLYTPSPGE